MSRKEYTKQISDVTQSVHYEDPKMFALKCYYGNLTLNLMISQFVYRNKKKLYHYKEIRSSRQRFLIFIQRCF